MYLGFKAVIFSYKCLRFRSNVFSEKLIQEEQKVKFSLAPKVKYLLMAFLTQEFSKHLKVSMSAEIPKTTDT